MTAKQLRLTADKRFLYNALSLMLKVSFMLETLGDMPFFVHVEV